MKSFLLRYGPGLIAIGFGLMMLNSGVNKFLGYMPHPPLEPAARALVTAFTAAGYMWPAVALTEIVGGVFVILPRLRAAGAVLLMPITLNVFLLDLFLNRSMLWIGVSVLALNLVVLASQYRRLLPVLASPADPERV